MPQYITAQEENLSGTIVSIAEQLADDESDPESVAIYIDRLHELKENPVILNSADVNELSRLFFLTDFQIKALADYIHSTGKVFSVFEIANVPGFDRELTEMVIPFVSLETSVILPAGSARISSSFLTNLSLKWPGAENSVPGSPLKIMTRYRMKSNNLSAGIITEKDSGEKILSGKPPLPDFLSAHLDLGGTGIIKKIIIGDFRARFGLGTNINTGLKTGLSLTAPGYLSGGDEIKEYTSADENSLLRGAAMAAQYRKISLAVFYSSNNIDASTGSFTGTNTDHIESFYTSGLHDSYSSLRKKDAVRETDIGLNLSLNLKKIRIGALYTETRFPLPVKPVKTGPADLYSFEGDRNRIATGYYRAVLDKVILFGEFSTCLNGKAALVQGGSFRPGGRLNLNFLYRKYDPGYTAFHGKAPFSSSSGDNTEGIFANFIFEAAKHLFLSAGCDLRNYAWLKYRCSSPSRSVSSEVRLKFLPSEKLSAEAAYYYRYNMLNINTDKGIIRQTGLINRSVRGVVRYSPLSFVTFTTRFDYRIAEPSGSVGILLLQDASFRISKIPLSIWLRYCIFGTKDWESRIYTYENDILYSFSIPALSGEGSRSYLMVDWRINKSFDLRIKYGLIDKPEEVSGERRTNELKMQVKIWF